jgi:hypothetical protein
VLVLGLLGTFYGLTSSMGKLVHLLAAEGGADVGQAVTHGLTDALAGMAVAFSNSLVGVGSAVLLTLVGVISNVTDRRTALMVQMETHIDRWLTRSPSAPSSSGLASATDFNSSIARLADVVARFEDALDRFAVNTRNLREVQLIVALKSGDRP